MAKQVASASERVRYKGRSWTADSRQDVIVRELKPGQGPSGEATHVTAHPESGKQRAGWRLEWIILLCLWLAFTCLGFMAVLPYAAHP
jgi:hypothetical protein